LPRSFSVAAEVVYPQNSLQKKLLHPERSSPISPF